MKYLKTIMGNLNLLHNRAYLTLQVNKEDKQLREIDIFFDWNEYIRLRPGASPSPWASGGTSSELS